MKKIFLSLIAIAFTFQFSFSQGVGSNPELPILLPQSPEAYALGKYGEVDVNESTGSISPSIPLYTYQGGNISIPISLAYSGNGVKVDQRPTTTGINWNLIAGGAITRQVRDRPDELAYSSIPLYNNRLFYDDDTLHDLNGSGLIPSRLGAPSPPSEWVSTIVNLATTVDIDTEVDIFNYNFMGYSGSFYIDENWEPILIKYDKEIKIDISNIHVIENQLIRSEITITTSDGVKYLFGGDNDSDPQENSNSGAEYSSSHNGSAGPTEEVLNSFYLTKITHPNADTVNFEYNYTSVRTYKVGEQESLSITYGACSGSQQTNYSPFNAPVSTYSKTIHQRILSKISSSRTNETIEFNRIDSDNFKNTLEDIIVKKGTNIVKKFDLAYLYPTGDSERFYLESVDELNSSNQSFGKKYSMDYDSPHLLPSMFSKSQDHYGYFNGKTNSTLIPSGVNSVFDNHYSLADREPVFDKAKYGSLASITYPTGGITYFEYESGYDPNNILSQTIPHHLKIYHNDAYNQTLQIKTKLIVPSLLSGNIPKTQTVTASYNIETDGDIIHKEWVRIEVQDENSNVIANKDIELENPENNHNSISGTINFDIIEGINYTVILKFVNGVGTSMVDNLSQPVFNDAGIHITATLNYEYAIDSPPIYAEALGIRIKSITNKLVNQDIADYKRYYYNTKENRSFNFNEYSTIENPKKVFFPMYYSVTTGEIVCPAGDGFEIIPTEVTTLKSSSLTSLFIDDSSKKMYPAVTVSYGGDNFENGGKEMNFIVKGDRLPHNYLGRKIYTSNRDHVSLENGTKLKEVLFKKDGIQYDVLKETNYNYKNTIYNSDISSKVVNTIVQKEFAPQNDGNLRVDYINIGLYETYSRWHGIESVVTKEYFGNNVVTTTQVYDYESNLAGLPTHEYSTSSDEITTLKRTYYPDEVTTNSSLGHDNLTIDEKNAIDKLKKDQLFRIGEPVQVEIYKDINDDGTYQASELLNTQRTNYFHYYDLLLNIENIVPSSVETAKEGNELESRITYHSYYDNGNVKELSKKEGTHIVYIWGYNEQYPIAKIENSTYASIEALSAFGPNFNIVNGLSTSQENALRGLSNAMVTTYTYDPPIGVTSITDPRGRTIYYTYDEFNRLKFVKDHDGKILSENEYNYKN